jgi:hypothetical protein
MGARRIDPKCERILQRAIVAYRAYGEAVERAAKARAKATQEQTPANVKAAREVRAEVDDIRNECRKAARAAVVCPEASAALIAREAGVSEWIVNADLLLAAV